MTKFRWTALAVVLTIFFALGIGAAAQVAGGDQVCATATASTPSHTLGVDGGAVYTIPGDVATATECAPVPTETVTTVVTTTVSSDTIAPSTPTNFRQLPGTSTSLVLAWDGSSDNVGVAGYEIKFHNNAGYTDVGNSLTYTFTGLNCGGLYNLDLRAYDAAGNRSEVAIIGPISPGCSTRTILFGASTAPNSAHNTTTREAEAKWLEGKMGRKLGITRHYVKAPGDWTGDSAGTSVTNGRVVYVTFTSGGDTWNQVANGSLDSYVRTQAAATASRGGLWCQSYIAFENEPEADPGKGSAADYVRAYEHIIKVGDAAGMCAKWTTALMEFSWQSGSGRNPEAWIPDGLDALGVHGYSTRVGTCGGDIRSFVNTFDGPHATAAKFGLRMVIGEAGYSTKAGADPSAKADFFRSIPSAMSQLPLIDAFAYWNSSGGGCNYANSFYVDSSAQALQGWVDAGHASILGG